MVDSSTRGVPPAGMEADGAHSMSRREFLGSGAALTATSGFRQRGPTTSGDAPPTRQADVLASLRGIPATLLCDALTRLGYPRSAVTMARDIRPMVPSSGTIIGPAITTKYELSRERGSVDDIRQFVFTPVDQAAAGDIWVTACGTDEVLSMLGELIALACRRQGIAGIVTDGGCRDVDGLERIGVPMFARGAILYGPGSVIRPVAANVPVVCGGAEVRPGDIIAADANGVLVIPSDALPEVIRLTGELRAKEEETHRLIEQGGSLTESYIF